MGANPKHIRKEIKEYLENISDVNEPRIVFYCNNRGLYTKAYILINVGKKTSQTRSDDLEYQYSGGEYIVELVIDKFPDKAPVLTLLTPNGRYESCKSVCLNGITHYHDGGWNFANNLHSTLPQTLLSTMTDDSPEMKGIAYIKRTPEQRLKLASKSKEYNRENHMDIIKMFEEMEPEVLEAIEKNKKKKLDLVEETKKEEEDLLGEYGLENLEDLRF